MWDVSDICRRSNISQPARNKVKKTKISVFCEACLEYQHVFCPWKYTTFFFSYIARARHLFLFSQLWIYKQTTTIHFQRAHGTIQQKRSINKYARIHVAQLTLTLVKILILIKRMRRCLNVMLVSPLCKCLYILRSIRDILHSAERCIVVDQWFVCLSCKQKESGDRKRLFFHKYC